ncbi:Na+/H+ antiporter NhaA [Dactylosporangium sp. NPDC051541]|uniref:Na+/H+ antiporter NhaA n=1 Tax=Dactylosporangium sp. NPDC051541 TaxID=3363977 RepID=UPI0037AF2AB8
MTAPSRRLAELLRTETVGGLLLLVAALAAFAWANSPWAAAYDTLGGVPAGGLTLAEWAADGLLAIFFFVAGLELKRELVAGDLRDPRRAILPVAAAVGGMAVPALLYVALNASTVGGDLRGWAVPTATDIAFALAVLAVAGSRAPAPLRTFLLTLAVVDDLLAILIIAVVYTSGLALLPLLAAALPLAAFAWLVRRSGWVRWLLPFLAVAVWALVHASGVHATVAGVLLAFTVPVNGAAERLEHVWRPVSAGFAVPVFAFFAAGVPLAGPTTFTDVLRDPVTLGVLAGLVLGKPIGVVGVAWLTSRVTRAPLMRPRDLAAAGLLSGIGFTVSLLIAELAFGPGDAAEDHARLAVLLASVLAAAAAVAVLLIRRAPAPVPGSGAGRSGEGDVP